MKIEIYKDTEIFFQNSNVRALLSASVLRVRDLYTSSLKNICDNGNGFCLHCNGGRDHHRLSFLNAHVRWRETGLAIPHCFHGTRATDGLVPGMETKDEIMNRPPRYVYDEEQFNHGSGRFNMSGCTVNGMRKVNRAGSDDDLCKDSVFIFSDVHKIRNKMRRTGGLGVVATAGEGMFYEGGQAGAGLGEHGQGEAGRRQGGK